MRGPRRPSIGISDSGWESSVDNTLTTEDDRHGMRPSENISDEVIRRKFCFLWWWEKSAFWYVAGLCRHSIIYLVSCRKKCFHQHYQGYIRGVNTHHCTLPTDSLLTLHYLCSWKTRILHFKIQLEPYELGINLLQNLGSGIRYKR